MGQRFSVMSPRKAEGCNPSKRGFESHPSDQGVNMTETTKTIYKEISYRKIKSDDFWFSFFFPFLPLAFFLMLGAIAAMVADYSAWIILYPDVPDLYITSLMEWTVFKISVQYFYFWLKIGGIVYGALFLILLWVGSYHTKYEWVEN